MRLPAVDSTRLEVGVDVGIVQFLAKMLGVGCGLLGGPAHDDVEDVVEVS